MANFGFRTILWVATSLKKSLGQKVGRSEPRPPGQFKRRATSRLKQQRGNSPAQEL